MREMTQDEKKTNTRNLMSNIDKYVLAFFLPIYASGQFKDYRVSEK